MTSFKKNIESGFENFGEFLYRFRRPLLVILFLIALITVRQIPKLTFDMSDEGFLHPDDPILQTYFDFRNQFGRDDLIVFAVKGDVFSQPFLKKLSKLHKTLEDNVPHVDEITSMVNARNTRGVEGGLIVEDLLEKWPQDPEQLEELRQRVMANPLYRDRLISDDGTLTTVLIQTDVYGETIDNADILDGFDEFAGFDDADMSNPINDPVPEPVYLSEQQKGKLIMAATKIAANFHAPDFQIHIAGSPIITHTVKKTMRQDMKLFLRLALLTIAVSLFIMFRRVSAVLLPIVVVILSLTATLALMVLNGTAFKMPTMILPSFILAVGVGDSVHILTIFFQHFNKYHIKKDAIVHALGHSGLPVVMTSLTTAAGLASFAVAKIAPVADLGIFAAIGVMLAMVFSIVFLPVLLALVPLKQKSTVQTPGSDRMTNLMNFLTDFSTSRSKSIVVVCVVIMAFSILGLSKIRFSHDILTWLPDKLPVRQATQTIDATLKGSVTLDIVLDTGRENGLYDPVILNKIEQFSRELEADEQSLISVGKVMSVSDILKEIHQALHENRADYYGIPQNKKLIPQEFLLFENSGSDDLEDVVDSRFQLARITIKVPWQDAMHYVPFIADVEKRAKTIFGSDADITVTGIMSLFGRIIYASIYSAGQSYLIAFAVITIMMIFLIGNIRLGLLCMFPNLAPIVITMGLMGWLSIPVNMFTMLIGSIAIGIAVDDTVHFAYNFRRYFSIHGDAVSAIRQTLQSAGRAMLATTVILSIGFFIFMFASMQNFFYFGLLTGTALLLALAADFLLAPALFTLVSRTSGSSKNILKR